MSVVAMCWRVPLAWLMLKAATPLLLRTATYSRFPSGLTNWLPGEPGSSISSFCFREPVAPLKSYSTIFLSAPAEMQTMDLPELLPTMAAHPTSSPAISIKDMEVMVFFMER